jgi:hypothetical protein
VAPSAAPSAAAVAPATSSVAAPTAPAKTCASTPDVELCSRDCEAGNASACEALGDLYERQEDETLPGFSMGYALSAFGTACSSGAKTACDKAEARWQELRGACQKRAKDCAALGRAASAQESDDKEADQSFARACEAGDGAACEARGELHQDWEPPKLHAAIAAQSLDRACGKGLASACCSLIKVYTDTEQKKEADAARKRFEVANDESSGPRLACDVFDLRRKPRVEVVAKADADAGKALTPAEIASLEEVFSRKVAHCYARAPEAAAVLDVDLVADGAAKLVAYTGGDDGRCVTRVVESIHLPGKASRRARFTLGFEALDAAK